MTRFLLIVLAILGQNAAFSQTDSLFLNSQSKPIVGKVFIQFKKNRAVVQKTNQGRAIFPFNDIQRISLANGEVYLTENIKSQMQPALLLVQGKYSLFFNEKDKLFYVKRNDSLLVVSKEHYKLALPVIFGRQVVDELNSNKTISPSYAPSYLTRLTSYANQQIHSPKVVYEQSTHKFKATLSIGPYIGFAHNKIAYDLYWDNKGGVNVYKKSDWYTSTSVPVGLTIDLGIFKRVSIRLDAYLNNTSNQSLDIANMGNTKRPFSVLNSDNYSADIKFTGYAYKTIHFDLAATYTLLSEDKGKLRPFILAGPSIVVMHSNENSIAVGYRETTQDPFQYITRKSELQRPIAMIALNAGAGLQYQVSDRIAFRLSGKYIYGLFPKLISPGFGNLPESNIPMPSEAWNQLYHRFQNAYDQYTRIITVSGALHFRL